MLNDMQFVYDTLSVQYHENHIIVYGRSMGSGFATKVAADNTPRYLIIDSPYYSFRKVAERYALFCHTAGCFVTSYAPTDGSRK